MGQLIGSKQTRSQLKKKFKLIKFYKACREDLFWRFLNKTYENIQFVFGSKKRSTNDSTNDSLKPNKIIKMLPSFFKKKVIKKSKLRKWKWKKGGRRFLFYVWRLQDVFVSKYIKRKKTKAKISLYVKKFQYYFNNMNLSRIKTLGSQLNKTFWSCFQTFFFKLETRLDILVYRLHFCKTTREAKHFIHSRNFCVNGKVVTNHFANINLGDFISIRLDKRCEMQTYLLGLLKHPYLKKFRSKRKRREPTDDAKNAKAWYDTWYNNKEKPKPFGTAYTTRRSFSTYSKKRTYSKKKKWMSPEEWNQNQIDNKIKWLKAKEQRYINRSKNVNKSNKKQWKGNKKKPFPFNRRFMLLYNKWCLSHTKYAPWLIMAYHKQKQFLHKWGFLSLLQTKKPWVKQKKTKFRFPLRSKAFLNTFNFWSYHKWKRYLSRFLDFLCRRLKKKKKFNRKVRAVGKGLLLRLWNNKNLYLKMKATQMWKLGFKKRDPSGIFTKKQALFSTTKNQILYNYPVYLEVNWRLLTGILVRQRVLLSPLTIPDFTVVYADLIYNWALR